MPPSERWKLRKESVQVENIIHALTMEQYALKNGNSC